MRLVKGAYWDYETVLARQEGWPAPVFTHKPDSDVSYERLARLMLESVDVVRPAFASHNVRSLAAAIATARRLGVPDDGFEIQMLHGMGDPIKAAVRAHGPAAARVRARSASSSPAWPTSCAACSRTPPTSRSCATPSPRAPTSSELVAAPAPSAGIDEPPPHLALVAPTDPAAPGPFANMPHADFARAREPPRDPAGAAPGRGAAGAATSRC